MYLHTSDIKGTDLVYPIKECTIIL